MNFKLSIAIAFLSILSFQVHGQDEGDDLFNTTQVISVNISFYTDDFWDVLVDEYETDQDYLIANVELVDVLGTTTLDSVGVRLKGNSSYSHPGNKKSFKLDFNRFTADDGQNYHGVKKLNFSNGFKDPSFMREKSFLDVCQQAGVLAPRANYADVYMNGTHWGFYTVIEQIDDQFLDRFIENDDGNLFKAGDNFGFGSDNGADLVFYGNSQSDYEDRYELKTNEDINDWSDLIEFIDFLNNSPDDIFELDIENQIDFIPLLRSMVLDNMFSNLDAYIGSARNYYIYNNTDADQWEWIKWDANETYGMYGGMGLDLEELALNYHDIDRPLVERIFDNASLYEMYLDEYCDILVNYFSNDHIDPMLDEYFELIDDYVLADDNKMYSYQNFVDNIEEDIFVGGGMGGGNAFGLKSFISNKSSFLENELSCPTSVDEYDFSDRILYPNPARDEVMIQYLPGRRTIVSFYNSNGKLVLNEELFNSRIHVASLNPGLYLVVIQEGDNQYIQRLILE